MSQFSSNTPSKPKQEGSARLVIIALVIALVAVILVNIYIEVARKQAAGGSFVVYRMKRSLDPGDEIQERYLQAVPIPDDFKETFQNAIKRAPTGKSERDGEFLKRPVEMHEILTYSHFDEDIDKNLLNTITPGNRLIALPVESDILPAIGQGMFVDIAAPFVSGDPAPKVLLVKENVQILSIGRETIIDTEGDDGQQRRRLGNFKTISIEVSPVEALQLSKIQKIIPGPFELHIRPSKEENRSLIQTPDDGRSLINIEVLKKINEYEE